MTDRIDRIGRGWVDLSADEKLEALRDNALGHGGWVRVLIQAVERLGVRFDLGGEDVEDPPPCS